jgi:hypothetical protein
MRQRFRIFAGNRLRAHGCAGGARIDAGDAAVALLWLSPAQVRASASTAALEAE